jgi:hypothetical protein
MNPRAAVDANKRCHAQISLTSATVLANANGGVPSGPYSLSLRISGTTRSFLAAFPALSAPSNIVFIRPRRPPSPPVAFSTETTSTVRFSCRRMSWHIREDVSTCGRAEGREDGGGGGKRSGPRVRSIRNGEKRIVINTKRLTRVPRGVRTEYHLPIRTIRTRGQSARDEGQVGANRRRPLRRRQSSRERSYIR